MRLLPGTADTGAPLPGRDNSLLHPAARNLPPSPHPSVPDRPLTLTGHLFEGAEMTSPKAGPRAGPAAAPDGCRLATTIPRLQRDPPNHAPLICTHYEKHRHPGLRSLFRIRSPHRAFSRAVLMGIGWSWKHRDQIRHLSTARVPLIDRLTDASSTGPDFGGASATTRSAHESDEPAGARGRSGCRAVPHVSLRGKPKVSRTLPVKTDYEDLDATVVDALRYDVMGEALAQAQAAHEVLDRTPDCPSQPSLRSRDVAEQRTPNTRLTPLRMGTWMQYPGSSTRAQH